MAVWEEEEERRRRNDREDPGSKSSRARDVPGADADADKSPGAPTPETGIIASLRSIDFSLTINVWRGLNKFEKLLAAIVLGVSSLFIAATILRFLAMSIHTATTTTKTTTEPEWTDDGACLNSTGHLVLCRKPGGGFVLPGDWEEAAEDGTEPGE